MTRRLRNTRRLPLKLSAPLFFSAALVASVQPTQSLAAPAQTASNTVNICAGVRLPNAAVTGIVQPLTNATATLETTTNSIIGTLSPLLGIPRVQTTIVSLMSGASTGYTSLQATATDGTAIDASGKCFSAASGFTLSAPAGIAIGGNSITGLDDPGKTAIANELGAIAFGNTASTAAGATDAIALGTGAQVATGGISSIALGSGAVTRVANSLALGAGSVAQRGAASGYAAVGLTSPQTSVGEVSIGALGGARQLTNVAAGSADTDAANVAQLSGVAQSVAALNASSVQYSSASKSTIALGGPSGTIITNVAAGSLAAGSSDAVNGGQLLDTNAAVASNAIAIGTLGSRVTANTSAIGAAGDAVSALSANVANGRIGPVRYSDAANAGVPNTGISSQDLALVGAGTGTVGLHNVGNGVLAAGSTDAVNGGQLFVTNAAVAATVDAVAGLGARVAGTEGDVATAGARIDLLSRGGAGPLRYSDPASATVPNGGTPSQDATLVGSGAGSVGLHNVSAGTIGAGSTDAVNGDQLFVVSAGLAANTGALSDLRTDVVATRSGLTSLSGQVAINGAAIGATADAVMGLRAAVDDAATRLGTVQADVASNMSGLASLSGRVAIGETAIGATADAIADLRSDVVNARIGPVRFADPSNPTVGNGGVPSQDLAFVGVDAGPVGLHNVHAGILAAGSTDAVNGGQLFATDTALAGLSGRVDAIGTSVAGNDTLLGSIDARTTTNIASINDLSVSLGVLDTNVTLLVGGGAGPVRYSNRASPTVPQPGPPTQELTLVGAGNGPVGLHNVADGTIATGSTDAVNGGQLHAALAGVTGGSPLAVTYDDGSRARISLASSTGGPVAIANVAPADLSATSSEAVNGAQLYATNRGVSDLGTRIEVLDGSVQANASGLSGLRTDFASFASLVERGGTGPLRYADGATPTLPNGGVPSQDLALIGRLPGAVGLHNVAAGRVELGSTDAINGDQLHATDLRITELGGRVDGIETRVADAEGTIAAVDARVTAGNVTVTDLGVQVGLLRNGGSGPVQYSDAAMPTTPNGGMPSQHLTLVGSGAGAVSLHNVAEGNVAEGSTDAVNGAQLFGLGRDVQSLSDRVQYAVTYDDVARTRVTFGGGNGSPVTLTNIAAGTIAADSTDAINGAQFYGLRQDLDTTTGRITTVIDRIDSVATIVADDRAALAGLGTRFDSFSSAVSNGAVGPVRYSSAGSPTTPNGGVPSMHVTLAGSDGGAVALHNLAPGGISAMSLDAINGTQLATLGSGVAAMLGLGYDGAANGLTGSFVYNGNSYASVQSVFGVIQADIGSGPAGAGKYFHANSTMTDSSAEGIDSTAVGPDTSSKGVASVAMGRSALAASDSAVAIGDQAKAMSGKAVSIGMGNIAAGDGAVSIGDPNIATGNGAVALGKDNTATGLGAVAIGNVNSAIGDGAAAIGDSNRVAGLGAVAIGSGNDISGDSSIAIGLANTVSGDRSLAIGNDVVNSAPDSLAIGEDVAARGRSSVAIGNLAAANGMLSGAFGYSAVAAKQYSLALGPVSNAGGFASTAVGVGAIASAFASDALGAGATSIHEGSVAVGTGSYTTRGPVPEYAAFGLVGSQASAGEIAVARSTGYISGETGQPTLTGNRQITGVAAGSADSDAVNVTQLRGAASLLGSAAAAALGGGAAYDPASGTLLAPRYEVAGRTYDSVGDALSAIGSGSTSPGPGGTPPAPASGASSDAVLFDDPGHGSVTLAGAGTVIRNVADGRVATGSTDAVNGGQLATIRDQIAALRPAPSGSATSPIQYVSPTDTTTPTPVASNDVTLVGSNPGTPVAVHNVADGKIGAGSTDAVNGGQLAATNARVADAQERAGTAQSAVQTAVRYDGPARSSATLGDGSTPVALHNVADGTTVRDAVNLGQLASAAGAIMADGRAYTDARITRLAFNLDQVRKDANAGTAGALAMASMPQPYEAGRGMLSMAAGTFQGQSALALGMARAMNDEHTIVKVGATYDTRGRMGAGAGVGYQF